MGVRFKITPVYFNMAAYKKFLRARERARYKLVWKLI